MSGAAPAGNEAAGRGPSGKDPTAGTPFEAVIGLETHAQLSTRSKLFCGCKNCFGEEPNTRVCPVCLGHPGSLPVVNRAAVEQTIKVGLALGCEIARFTKFDRKNYFYPDLPKNYQISQFDRPLALGGQVEVVVAGLKRQIRLVRIHLEEDAGKNIHVEDRPESWVDLNRAGVPLLEIVSQPDLRTPEEASAYLKTLRLILLCLGVSDGNMEEGSLRCDVNISIRPRGSSVLETRTEIKNLNSFANVESALVHEIRRQIKVRSRGGAIEQQTLLFDPNRGETRPMRGKEEAHDYRYFPDPDLTPLQFSDSDIEAIARGLPELPGARFERLQAEYGVAPYHAEIIVRDLETAVFFEDCARLTRSRQAVANWIVNSVLEEVNRGGRATRGFSIKDLGLTPARLVGLIDAIDAGRVSNQKAKDVFRGLLDSGASVDEVIRSLGLEQISDTDVLRQTVVEVLQGHPGPVDDVRKGKRNSVNFLVGQVMRRTQGKANPGAVAKLIEELIAAG